MGPFELVERNHGIPDRAYPDLLAREVEADVLLGAFHGVNGLHGDQHAFAEPPVARVDYKILQAPVLVFEHEIRDMPDIPIARVDVVSDHLDHAAKMRVAISARRSEFNWTPRYGGAIIGDVMAPVIRPR
jgi:hypothetical protein